MEGYDYKSLRGPAALLHDVLVDPDHRGHGVGRQLLDQTLSMMQAKGARQTGLSTPDRRGHGVGRQLLDETLSMMQAKGARQIVLSTAERNEAAQRLFARMGFRPTTIEMTRELE